MKTATAGFADQVPFLGSAVLNDYDPLEFDPVVPGPFLYGLFVTLVKSI
ncbi:MAG: hypothetical protein NT004_12705 [Bacteroidetes bacterium]|nr:hypothetical protein [Bacteroidota bacterium]